MKIGPCNNSDSYVKKCSTGQECDTLIRKHDEASTCESLRCSYPIPLKDSNSIGRETNEVKPGLHIVHGSSKTSTDISKALSILPNPAKNDSEMKTVGVSLSRFKFQRICKPRILCRAAVPTSSAVKAARAAVQRSCRKSHQSFLLGQENLKPRLMFDEEINAELEPPLFKAKSSRIDSPRLADARCTVKARSDVDIEGDKKCDLNSVSSYLVTQGIDEPQSRLEEQLRNLGHTYNKQTSIAPLIAKSLKKIRGMKRCGAILSNQISANSQPAMADDDVDFQQWNKKPKLKTKNIHNIKSCGNDALKSEINLAKDISLDAKSVVVDKISREDMTVGSSVCSTSINSEKCTFLPKASKLVEKIIELENIKSPLAHPATHQMRTNTERTPSPIPKENRSQLNCSVVNVDNEPMKRFFTEDSEQLSHAERSIMTKNLTDVLELSEDTVPKVNDGLEQDLEPLLETYRTSKELLASQSVAQSRSLIVEMPTSASSTCVVPEVILIDDDDVSQSMDDQIKSLTCVEDLTDDQIKHLVSAQERFLREIFEGKTLCQRHIEYRDGGLNRNALSFAVVECLFTEDQRQAVMAALMQIFCKNHNKYFDYLLKVLMPEMLVKLFQLVQHLEDRELAEQRIMDAAIRRDSL